MIDFFILIPRCIYVMPKDIPLSIENGTPYELNVEVIKDCTNFTNDVLDVITLIRNEENDVDDGEPRDYRTLVDKVRRGNEKLYSLTLIDTFRTQTPKYL